MISRKLSHLALVLAIAGVLMGAGSLSDLLFSDNFSSGTDANWTQLDLLTPLGGTNYDASSGRYVMSSNIALPALPFQVFTGSLVTDSLGNEDYRNVKIKAKIRFNNANTNVLIGGRVDASQAAIGVVTGYGFGFNNITNEISIGRVDPSGGFPPTTITTLVSVPFAFTEGVDYEVVARLKGANIKLKVWPSGGNEPQNPQLSVNDTVYQEETTVAAGIYTTIGTGGQLSGSVDNVKVKELDDDDEDD